MKLSMLMISILLEGGPCFLASLLKVLKLLLFELFLQRASFLGVRDGIDTDLLAPIDIEPRFDLFRMSN